MQRKLGEENSQTERLGLGIGIQSLDKTIPRQDKKTKHKADDTRHHKTRQDNITNQDDTAQQHKTHNTTKGNTT